jgi:hypothetical protein
LQGPGTPYTGIGKKTRFNPKLRYFPNLNENLSVAKSFPTREQVRMEFRAEAAPTGIEAVFLAYRCSCRVEAGSRLCAVTYALS